jgi:hypothetical protein
MFGARYENVKLSFTETIPSTEIETGCCAPVPEGDRAVKYEAFRRTIPNHWTPFIEILIDEDTSPKLLP